VSVETPAYAALGARLKISPVAARRLPGDCACRDCFRCKALVCSKSCPLIPELGRAIVRQNDQHHRYCVR
jgi:hypothetical protein